MENVYQQKWKMLFLTMFCYLFFYAGRHNFGWAAKQLSEELNVSFEKIGWVSFAMLVGYAAGQLIHGGMADRRSPKHMIALGGLLSTAMNILISFSSSFTVILTLWGLNGYFQSMAWAAGGRILTNWWPVKQRGMAFGMYTMAAASSSILTYISSILLVQEGWRNLFRIPVFFLAGACILFFILVRNGPLETEMPGTPAAKKPEWKRSYLSAFGNRRFLIVCLSLGFQSMARYGLIFWIPLYFMSHTANGSHPPLWLSVLLPLGMALGALFFGLISDKFFSANRTKSIFWGMATCSALSILLFVLPLTHTLMIGTLVFGAGFFAYGPQASFWPLSAELLGADKVGTGIGIMNMCAYLFAAIGEPLMGQLIDTTGNKAILFLAISLIALASALTIQWARFSGLQK